MRMKIPIIGIKKDNSCIYQKPFAAAIENRNCLVSQLHAVNMKFLHPSELYCIHANYQKVRRNIYEYFA